MTGAAAIRALVLLGCLLSQVASAQLVPDREVQIIQSLYDAGQYAAVVKRVEESLAVANFNDAQRVKLLELRALSSFNSGDTAAAKSTFLSLLKLDPDAILDPFAVSPPAIKLFEQVKKDNVDTLNLARQQIALRAEQEKRAAAERERQVTEAEARRRAEEGLVTVRTIEKRSMLVNFLPFGAGQFQQGRLGAGAAFAVVEGVLAVLSIVSFFAVEGLYQDVELTFTDRVRPEDLQDTPFVITVRQIPNARRTERDVWNGLKFSTGIAFYALWAAGVGEAIWNHQSESVTEQQVPLKELKPTARLRLLGQGPEEPALRRLAARLRLFPTPGGLGAGVSVRF